MCINNYFIFKYFIPATTITEPDRTDRISAFVLFENTTTIYIATSGKQCFLITHRIMPKWSAKKEGKLLCSLFDEGVADPSFTKASDIDEIKNLKPESAYFTDRRFRDNCKSTGKS